MILEKVFSYYPSSKILHNFFPYGKKKLYFYIDLKGCMRKIFKYDTCISIIQDTISSNLFNLSIVWDLLSLISYHNYYIFKYGLDVKYFVFLDIGTSIYHKNIYTAYKSKRESFKFLDTNEINSLYDILNKNYLFLKKLSSFIPNFYVILLENIESDFVPYYLITKKFSDDSDVLHIIYSPDKDMHQCLLTNNVIQLFISSTRCSILNCDNVWDHVLEKVKHKKIDISRKFDIQYFPLYLALIGDRCDNIQPPRVQTKSNRDYGMTPLKFVNNYDHICDLCENMENIYENIYTKNKLLPESKVKVLLESKKYDDFIKMMGTQEDIIVRNLKLISFHYLCYYYLLRDRSFFTDSVIQIIDESITDENKNVQSSKKIFDILTKVCKLKVDDKLFYKLRNLSFQ